MSTPTPMTKKAIRSLAGYTFLKVDSDPKNWFERAHAFNSTADLIVQRSESPLGPTFYFNAALALEIALKAIIIAKSKSFRKDHNLLGLVERADIKVSKDQECTLELLSEIISWSGRYPTPKTEEKWDHYHDQILEKHIIRNHQGNTHSVMQNESRFPNYANYLKLWQLFENEFNNALHMRK